jgi:phage-related protein
MKQPIVRTFQCLALLTLASLFLAATPASSQTMQAQDNDITRRQIAGFDGFLDSHPETAEQLRKDPTLINNEAFVKSHPGLQQYLQEHPEVREQLSANPNAFMQRERRYDQREQTRDDASRAELANFDRFLDGHRETAEQLRKDPTLVNNEKFVKDHPGLQQYLQEHPGVQAQLNANPNAVMQQERRFDQREETRDDASRAELANFDRFLDGHRETAEQLRKDPTLINKREFVKDHPGLQQYLQEHPGVQAQLSANPNAFMQDERRFDQREQTRDDPSRAELANFDRFLDGHRETAEQLRKDPTLVNNEKFVKDHPGLQQYLQEHPGVQQQLSANPTAVMQQERRFDQREEARNDASHAELANFDRFLDSHRETAEQLRKDPTLVNKQEFVKDHPGLQQYLQEHPGVQAQLNSNPNAFMQEERRFDHHEYVGDHDAMHGEMANFGQFLGSHSGVSQELSKNPSLATNEQYLESHPELKLYLQTHPGVQEGLKGNPQAFVKSAQQINANPMPATKTGAGGTGAAAAGTWDSPKTPSTGEKPKQQ